MKKTSLIITIVFLAYLAIIFYVFYNIDKRMLAMFCALGSSLYVVTYKRFSNRHSSK